MFRSGIYALTCVLCVNAAQLQQSTRIDGVVAVIGSEVILSSELSAYTNMRIGQLTQAGDSTAVLREAELKELCLDELIDGKVLLVRAMTDTTIKIKESDVEQQVQSYLGQLAQRNNLTMVQLEDAIKQQGTTLAKYRAQLRKEVKNNLLKKMVQDKYVSAMQPGKTEVEAFFNQYRDSLPPAGPSLLLSKLSIVVAPSDSVRQAAYDRIKKIKERIDAGGNFSDIAKQFSDDPNASTGGDLGFVEKGTLSEIKLEAAAFGLKVGQVSDIIETRLGFHLLTVTEVRDRAVHVQQILAAITPSQPRVKAIVSRLDSIRTTAQTSAAFADAVSRFSQDGATKARNGLMGWRSSEELPPSVVSAIDSLSEGSISRIVIDDNSYSLYRLDGRVESRKLTIEDDWDKISDIAQRINSQKRLLELVKKWRQNTFVSKSI